MRITPNARSWAGLRNLRPRRDGNGEAADAPREGQDDQAEGDEVTDWQEERIKELQLEEQSLAWLTREGAKEGNPYADACKAEIARRTAQAQIDAARYMKWSVIAIAITSGLTAFAAVAGWLWPNPLHFH